MAFPFQTEVSLQDWHYKAGEPYRPASEIITRLMQNVSRNGSLLLNITQRGRGDIEQEARRICEDIGRWLERNGDAVYSARPFDVWGDERVIYTRRGGRIYAVLPEWDGSETVLEALRQGAPSVGRIRRVRILGDLRARVRFRQCPEGLRVAARRSLRPVSGIRDTDLAGGFRVLEIVHTKGWFNDDDPGVSTLGWDRRCNLGTGDFNNDLCLTDCPGDVWTLSFTGRSVRVVAPTGPEYGRMRIRIDGRDCGEADLHAAVRSPQQTVFSARLRGRRHTIEMICTGGLAAIDALVIR